MKRSTRLPPDLLAGPLCHGLPEVLPLLAFAEGFKQTGVRHGRPNNRGVAGVALGHRAHREDGLRRQLTRDRKSTRLNSSHANISYAVFCLKKKKKIQS